MVRMVRGRLLVAQASIVRGGGRTIAIGGVLLVAAGGVSPLLRPLLRGMLLLLVVQCRPGLVTAPASLAVGTSEFIATFGKGKETQIQYLTKHIFLFLRQ